MNKKLSIIIGIIVIVFLLAWSFSEKKDTEETIKIGIAAGFTGYAAEWGEGELKAVELAYDDIKPGLDITLELIVEDTKTESLGTVNAMKKLIEINGVVAIIGPTWGDSYQGGFPIADKAKVTVITPSSAFEALEEDTKSSYIFSTWWPQNKEAEALARHMKGASVSKVAVIHDQDAFNIKIGEIFSDVAPTVIQGLAVSEFVVPIGTTDFRTHIAKIKLERPDAILVFMQDTSTVGPFIKQLAEQSVVAKIYSTTSAQNEENLAKFPGQFNGLLYSYPAYSNDQAYVELKKRFVAKYGDDAVEGPSFVNAYNAATALFTVIKDGARTGTEIRDGLKKVKVPGIGAPEISFDENGQIGNADFVIKTVKDNKFVEVE